MTIPKELYDSEAINNLSKSFDKPKTLNMSQDVYDLFKRSFYPISNYPVLTEDHDLVKFVVDGHHELDINIVPGEKHMSITGQSKYELVEDGDDN